MRGVGLGFSSIEETSTHSHLRVHNPVVVGAHQHQVGNRCPLYPAGLGKRADVVDLQEGRANLRRVRIPLAKPAALTIQPPVFVCKRLLLAGHDLTGALPGVVRSQNPPPLVDACVPAGQGRMPSPELHNAVD